jgi:hypothetical protein
MANPVHLMTLVTDIRDCARRVRELTEPHLASMLHEVADEIEREAKAAERSSLPPTLAGNQESRSVANKHFKNARTILERIIK